MQPTLHAPDRDRSVVAGRYTLLETIAHGGMGEVYRAFDREGQREVALKRLRSQHNHHALLFRAEFHALARLQHPYIIEVYEYGVDRGYPYYTMELLDGQDLLETPPAGISESCRMLRDVASSLALLHSQRLLHRDLGPRNVRRTSSGVCKLIDFGVMVPFGVPPNLAGTSPFVSPEAWEGSVLDQRSDLYSLGSLAYWLLTRTFTYDPKTSAKQGVAGQPPPVRMRRRAPHVPEALDELVMSLLELDPARRPASAAEVITRLNQIGGLEPDDTVHLAHSYLASAGFVGHTAEVECIERALESALDGLGSSWLAGGAPGMGRTRFLQEAALRAQTRGIRVVRAFGARAASNGGLVREVYQTLRRMAPDTIDRVTAADREILRRFDAETRSRVPVSGSDVEARDTLHAALVSYAHHATDEGTWLLLIDDLDRADRFSAGFIASLARKVHSRSLVVLATASGIDRSVGSSPASIYVTNASMLWLEPLDLAQTHSLASSLFGDTPNLKRTVAWLYANARGNPSLTMELSALLLRRGRIRYVEGEFVLPEDDIDEQVPADLARTLLLRLEPAGDHARRLAELVATCRGGPSLQLCLRASELKAEDAMTALEELVRRGVLTSVRGAYTFEQDAMRQAVELELCPKRARALHERLATAYGVDGETDLESTLEAGWHLLHTDRELEGAHLLSKITPTLFATDLSYAGAIKAAELATEVYDRRGAALADRMALRTLLVRAGYLYDHSLAQRYGTETVEMLERWLSLDLLRRLLPRLGSWGVLVATFTLTTLRWLFTWGERRGPHPFRALQYLGRAATSMLGVHALGLDVSNTNKMLMHFKPFAALPRGSAGHVLYLAARAFALHPPGREVELRRANAEVLGLLEAGRPLGMTERERVDLRVGLLLSAGVNECYRSGSRAFEFADKLDTIGTQIGYAASHRIRLTYHLVREGKDEAKHHQRMLEIHAIQGGTTWQVEWFAVPVEGTAAARNGNLMAARRSLERLEVLIQEVPSLTPLRDLVRLMYQHCRGNLELALELGEAFVRDNPPRSVIGWASGHATYAAALNDTGQFERARAIGERACGSITDEDREYTTLYGWLDRELAFTYAALGMDEAADALVRASIALCKRTDEPVLLSVEYENAARIARLRQDVGGLTEAVRCMREASERSGSSFAIARCRRSGAALLRSTPLDNVDSGVYSQGSNHLNLPTTSVDASELYTPVRSLGRGSVRNSLRLAMEQAGASCAFLLVVSAEHASVVAEVGRRPLPGAVEASARELAASWRKRPELRSTLGRRRLRDVDGPEQTYEVMLLPSGSSAHTAGVLVLGRDSARPSGDLSENVLETLTSCAHQGRALKVTPPGLAAEYVASSTARPERPE